MWPQKARGTHLGSRACPSPCCPRCQAAGGSAWGTYCLDKAIDLVWSVGGGTRGQSWPNAGPTCDTELQEDTTPHSAPSWALQASQPHTGAQLTRLLPCAGWILVFSLRAFGSLCSWAVHIQATAQLSCEHAAPRATFKNYIDRVGQQPPGGGLFICFHKLSLDFML